MPNHHPIATQGGASAVPTAANNTGGGSGWGDSGFYKGGGGEDRKESVSWRHLDEVAVGWLECKA